MKTEARFEQYLRQTCGYTARQLSATWKPSETTQRTQSWRPPIGFAQELKTTMDEKPDQLVNREIDRHAKKHIFSQINKSRGTLDTRCGAHSTNNETIKRLHFTPKPLDEKRKTELKKEREREINTHLYLSYFPDIFW